MGDYLKSNLQMFSGKSVDAESTILPAVTSWVAEAFGEIPEAKSYEDHGVCLWVNLPTAGIIGASKFDFLLTAITNVLWACKRNSIAIIVHPNSCPEPQPRQATHQHHHHHHHHHHQTLVEDLQ